MKRLSELHRRFTVYDGTTKLTSPFVGLSDWEWPWLPRGPPTWAIDED